VKHLNIKEDIFAEYQMMKAIVRKGWTLALVFGFVWSERDGNIKD